VVTDREEDLWPDPVERTYVRLSNLQFAVSRYVAERGDLPENLGEVLPQGPPAAFTRDAWDGEILFTVRGTDYELRSLGPDRQPNTPDDLVLTRGGCIPAFRDGASALTRTIMRSLQFLIATYRDRTGRLPENLSELQSVGLAPYLGISDGWKNPLVYTKRDTDFEIRSAGPDGIAGSGDDMVIVAPAPPDR
jgi:hypothetical protein